MAGREVAGSLIDGDEVLECRDLWVLVIWVLVAMLGDAVYTLVQCTLYPCIGWEAS